jgi:hypothetical protein
MMDKRMDTLDLVINSRSQSLVQRLEKVFR